MSTIQVITPTLKGGYGPIVEYYNTHKPKNWQPIQEAKVCEGGFEIRFTKEELGDKTPSDYNDKVKQVRWSKSRLITYSWHYGFSGEETMLLYMALKSSLGEDNVSF